LGDVKALIFKCSLKRFFRLPERYFRLLSSLQATAIDIGKRFGSSCTLITVAGK
jgi:hypothetical protein